MSASLVEDTAAQLVQFLKRPLGPILVGPAAPPDPPDVEPSSYTPLDVQSKQGRKLKSIERLKSLDLTIENYFTNYLNTKTPVPSLSSLTLPLAAPIALRHPGTDLSYTDFNPFIINSPNDLIVLLHRFLLRSICQILRVLDSFGDTACQDWTFTTIPFTRDGGRIENGVSNPDSIVLHPRGSTSSTTKPDNVRLVILPFTPWEFTKRDFENLTFLPIREPNDPKWTKYDQVWAYLYDICFDLNCPYFVITSYIQWCFGYFSQDYSTVHFVPIVSYEASSVSSSVIQMLIYWIQNNVDTNQTIHRKRPRCAEDSPLREGKRQRVHDILEADTTEAWRYMQGYIHLGPRFSPGKHHLRTEFELRHIENQINHHEKSKRRSEAIARARKARRARKAQRTGMAQAKKAEKVDGARIEVPPSTGEPGQTEEAPNVDGIEGEPSIQVEGVPRVEGVEAVGGASNIGEVEREVVEKTDMISWLEGVKGDMAEEDEMQMCEKVEDHTQTNGQPEEVVKADEDMMVDKEAVMTDKVEESGEGVKTVEDVVATEQVNKPEESEEPKPKEESDSDDSDVEVDESDKRKLRRTCEIWQEKTNRYNNTKNEYIYFEQPDSGLTMFGDREAYLPLLHSNYAKELELPLGDDGALYDCSKEDFKMYHEIERLRRILYRESL